MERTLGESLARLGGVGEFEGLVRAGQVHGVAPDPAATAHRVDADFPRWTRAGSPGSPGTNRPGGIGSALLCRNTRQEQRGSRRCVGLLAVVPLDDLDVVVGQRAKCN